MNQPPDARRVSRRSFLRALGLAAGACTLGPQALPAAPQQQLALDSAPLRVGVLLPQSRLAPQFAPHLLAGLQISFEQARYPVALQAVESGPSPAAALRQVRSLLDSERPDLLIGALSRHHLDEIAPLLAERRLPLVVSDVGANAIRPGSEHPWVVRSSLGHWRASYAAGQWAASTQGSRALVVASFYDSGYDTVYAFQSGFRAAGGSAVDTLVMHHPAHGHDLTPTLDAISSAQPDLVYAISSGSQAIEFVRAYHTSGLGRAVPLVGSSFLFDESLLAAQGEAALGHWSVSSWGPGLPLAEQRAFAHAFTARTGQPADAFAALGYDTGRIVAAAASAAAGQQRHLRAALAAATTDGARGDLAVQEGTLDALSPIYLRQVRPGTTGPEQQTLAQLLDARQAVELPFGDEPKTGWTNPYLCV